MSRGIYWETITTNHQIYQDLPDPPFNHLVRHLVRPQYLEENTVADMAEKHVKLGAQNVTKHTVGLNFFNYKTREFVVDNPLLHTEIPQKLEKVQILPFRFRDQMHPIPH